MAYRHNTVATDFPSYYYGSVVSQKGDNPYSWQALVNSAPKGLTVYPYLYSPLALLLFRPLSSLGFQESQLLFGIVNAICLLVLLVASYNLAKATLGGAPETGFGFIAALMFSPIVYNFVCGQINIFLAALVACSLYASERKKNALAGLLLAVAGLVKVLPYGFALYLLYRRQYRSLVWVGAWTAAILLVVVPLNFQQWEQFVAGMRSVGYGQTSPGLIAPSFPVNMGFAGFFARLFGSGTQASVIFTLATIVVLVGLMIRYRQYLSNPSHVGYTLTCVSFLIIFIPPLSWRHYLVTAIPGLTLLWAQLSVTLQITWKKIIALSLCIVFLSWNSEWTTAVYGKLVGWTGLDHLNKPPLPLQVLYAVNMLAVGALLIYSRAIARGDDTRIQGT